MILTLEVESRVRHIPAEIQWGTKPASHCTFFPPELNSFLSFSDLKCIDYGSYLNRKECSKRYYFQSILRLTTI
jgi:hypothetical protein